MDTTFRRHQKNSEQQSPGHVVFPDIVLNIQRALRHFRQPVTGGKGVQTVIERKNAALSGVIVAQRTRGAGEASQLIHRLVG